MLSALLVLLAGLSAPAAAAAAPASGQEATSDQALVARVVAAARAEVGDAYAWGGNGPDAWDCSGLTSAVWRDAGGVADVPRTSRAQQAWAVPLPREQLLPGDLVFYGDPVYHVALYVGDGRLVDAASSSKGVLERRVWSDRVVRYGRVPRPGMVPVTPWQDAEPAAGPAAGRPLLVPPRPDSGTVTTARSDTATAATGPAGPRSDTATAAAYAPPVGTARPLRLSRALGARASVPARRALVGLRSVVGQPAYAEDGWDDLALVRAAFAYGGVEVPATREALLAAGRPVSLRTARPGDVVVYGGGQHLAVVLGHGFVLSASAHEGRVVVRRAWAERGVRVLRLA